MQLADQGYQALTYLDSSAEVTVVIHLRDTMSMIATDATPARALGS